MARNIEIKARVQNLEDLRAKTALFANQAPVELFQDDWFFRCAVGRLKLRLFSAEKGELIFYQRPNERGPKESFYVITPTTTPNLLRETLSRAYGVVGRVRKQRTLFMVGRTRVHLDRVEGLGNWIELEVVLNENEPSASGIAEAQKLMGEFGIDPTQLVEGAYIDLIGSTDGA